MGNGILQRIYSLKNLFANSQPGLQSIPQFPFFIAFGHPLATEDRLQFLSAESVLPSQLSIVPFT